MGEFCPDGNGSVTGCLNRASPAAGCPRPAPTGGSPPPPPPPPDGPVTAAAVPAAREADTRPRPGLPDKDLQATP
ncbi:hypothetical protein GCM10010360_20270 [Streptomyces nogalater]